MNECKKKMREKMHEFIYSAVHCGSLWLFMISYDKLCCFTMFRGVINIRSGTNILSIYVPDTIFGYENPEMNNVQIGRTRTLDETEKHTHFCYQKGYN